MQNLDQTSNSCGFCKPEVQETQEILRTQHSRLIYPFAPMIYENIMVIPIRHVALIEDLIPEELVDIFDLVKRVNKYFQEFHNTTAYNLFINNGTAAGQHEPHAHFHFFGRSKTEEVSPYKKMKSPDLHHVEKLSSDELKRRVTEIRGRI